MKNVTLPYSVALELTYRCNHRCKFCSCPWYAPSSKYQKGNELNVDEWKTVVDILYDNGVKYFSLSGGEVLLKDGFTEVLSYIRKKGSEKNIYHPIVLISNGLNMTDEYLKLFKDLDVHLIMSLPGYQTFEYHTGVDNADGVLNWFDKAKAIGLTTTVNVTVTNKNFHELFETISFGLIHGADSVLLNRFLPGGRGLEYYGDLFLQPEQVNKMLETAEEVLSLSNRYGNVGTEIPYCAIQNPEKYKRIHFGYCCAAAKGFFVIDPSGKIRVCNHSPKVVGHIFDNPMIADVAYWNMFANSDYKPQMCNACNMKLKCDCGCREVAHIIKGSTKEIDTSIIH